MDKKWLQRFAGRSIARYIEAVYKSSRVVSEPLEVLPFLNRHTPCIVAVWHGQFLVATKAKPHEIPLRIMVAKHGDAEVYAQAVERFNIELIRGAGAGDRQKDRGGASALRAALRSLKEGYSIGMTADVPPGPARRAGDGIVMIAKLSGRPIIPLAAATSRYYAFKTWSRMTLNLPYGKMARVFGQPIYVPHDADAAMLEAARQQVEDELNAVTRRAYELVGADPTRATPPQNSRNESRARRLPTSLRTYRTVTSFLKPAAPLILARREQRGREDHARRNERFGIATRPRPDGRVVWLHAASVGELNAVLPLIDALRAERADLKFVVTTGTVTSAGIAARRLSPEDVHQYIPLDAPDYIARFLDFWRPSLAILTESEIWPNAILETVARGIPLALVNARMSDRSYDRWRRMPKISRALFGTFNVVLAQNETLAAHYRDLGAPNAVAAGNLKMDAPPPAVDETELAHLKEVFDGRPILLAASTHAGEERIVATAHRLLASRLPGLATIVAPRHPERGTSIAEEMRELGLTAVQRSLGGTPGPATDIYIADTIGELGTFYALAQVAFIGGSLVDKGGQNPIEAIRRGVAVIAGPHWKNFEDAYTMLLKCGGAIEVNSAEELARAVETLLSEDVELARIRAGATAALSTLAGAIDVTVHELLKVLPPLEEVKRAS